MIVSFTGHRLQSIGGFDIPNPTYNYIYRKLKEKLVELKPSKALSGMALGVDQIAAEICLELNIPLVAVVPFKGQELKWNKEFQDKYNEILSKAEVVIVSTGGYSAKKMQIRNEYLVDNCELLVAVWNGEEKGGTYNCIQYAKKVGREIFTINLNTTLYRPVGLKELNLISESGWKKFPPRLPGQPIFYPVVQEEYATKIAKDWNMQQDGIGYVVKFQIKSEHLEKYPEQKAGGNKHTEHWIPANELEKFNDNIVGLIKICGEYKND
jgi:uncharacterized phage-like protein YoqJ